MAAIALKRGGSFSSSNASSDNPFRAGGNLGMKSGGGGGVSGMGLYGSSLTSLQYQPHNRENGGGSMYRRQSFSRDQSIGSGMGDDLSLVGECDLSSTRSDKHRPGRRASLSAAIELTREAPPKRNVSGSRPRGRRNSLFGNKNSHSDDHAATPIKLERSASGDNPSSSLMKKPKGRRASMAGYPAAGSSGGPHTTSVEPELTPQFFHSRKKGSKKEKDGRSVPDRKKSKSFDKTSKSMLSSLGKIKRPKGSGGSRRASMSGMPRKMGLSRGGSKNSDMSFMSGASSSFRSHNSNHSSSYDLSDDESQVSESIYLHRDKSNSKATSKHTVTEDDGLGYGDHTTYDPQLPPPPPPVPTKALKSKRAFQNRRGSTGAAVSGFKTTASAQKSLKESIMWKQQAATTTTTSIYQKKNPYSSHHQQKQQQSSLSPQDRRASAASSVANSVATDVASNVKSMQNSNATTRRVPSDVPPSPRQRLGSTEYDSHDDDDDSNSDFGESIKTFETPTQTEKAKVTASKGLLGATTAGIVDVDEVTPQQSNRKIKSRASMITNQNASALGGSSLGLMDDSLNSETSEDNDPLAPAAVSASTVAAGRRASRGLSMLQKPSSALNVSTHGSGGQLGFNPYGSSSRREEDEDNDDDGEEDNEDTIGEFHQKDHDKTQKNITPEAAEATAATTITTEPTLDGSVDRRAEYSGNDKQTKDDDNTSASKVPSETQGDEKKPAVGIEGHNIDDHLEVIGATGDWSQGVGDDMLKPKSQGGDRNSLLDRYPGSEMDEMDLGYGPTHNTGNSKEEATMEHEYGNGYGPSDLYDEDYSSFGWREHRPRAADSIEYVNMEQLMSKAKNTKGLYLPTFVPAHGCSNASDFIVRCFVARLRAGMTVTKHSRSRFTKSHDRILHILPTGYHITWIPETEEEVVAKSKKSKQPTKLDLTKCLEVRHAWSRDPKSSKYTGTSTLRAKCKEGSANRSFALIYPHRTIDFTAATVDQCKILMEGFSALCFRLQMARLEQQSLDEDTQHTGMSAVEHDNDSTTASLTGTNMSSPWGL